MMFSKPLRAGVASGAITCSVRVWKTPRVRVGARYSTGFGAIEITRLVEIDPADVTPELARQSGFVSVAALFEVARHGRGERVFLVEFTYDAGDAVAES